METNQSIENSLILRALLHDLANPLALIMNAVACLEDGSSDMPPPEFFIEKIKKAALEQKAILETTKSLRNFFKEDGPVQLAPVNLDDVAQKTIQRFKAELEAKGIDVEFAIENDDDAILLADPVGFQTIVIDALIANALRFSAKGSVITVSAQRSLDRNEVCVKDSGVGMPKKVYDNLFDISKRIRVADLAGNLGAGLGLPLLKKYLDRCGATIQVSTRAMTDFPQEHGTEITMSFKAP